MSDINQRLWATMSKLYGVASLIKNWNGEAIAAGDDTHDSVYGLGLILGDLADELKAIWAELDSQIEQKSSKAEQDQL